MNMIKKILFGVVLLVSASFAKADLTALNELVSKLEHIQSMRCDFSQLIMDKGGTRLQEASGTMKVARGNRFRWHTQQPFEQLVISDGETVWIYDVDLEQVVQKKLEQEAGNTPALLFSGNPAAIAESFVVDIVDHSEQSTTYRLTPNGQEPLFEQLEMTFRGDTPTQMHLEDALGQKTNIEFLNSELNPDMAADAFDFIVPDGADVIQQ